MKRQANGAAKDEVKKDEKMEDDSQKKEENAAAKEAKVNRPIPVALTRAVECSAREACRVCAS